MADVMFNNMRGRLRQLILDGADLIVVLLKADEADDTLRDYDTLTALLGGSNTEADFTNYVRKVIDNGDLTDAVDDTANTLNIDYPDQTWVTAGGATNNNLVSAIVCIDGADDDERIPATKHDFVVTTDSNDLTLRLPTSPDGFYQSKDD